MEGTGRSIEVPSIEPSADGYVVFTTNSAQQHESLLTMIGRSDLLGDKPLYRAMNRFQRREKFLAAVHGYTTTRSSAEVLARAGDHRIPAGPVLKVESARRPDLMRYTSTKRPSDDSWWEWGPIFHAANAGKRGITLDLTRPEGVDVFERLLGTADVLIENYTPRVMEQFGLGWDRVHEVNPKVAMVGMPAFGLQGPWRDRTGFAQTMECITGMAWLTGFPDGPPLLVRGACDPLAGMHAVFATLLALAGSGGGRLVESVLVDAAVN